VRLRGPWGPRYHTLNSSEKEQRVRAAVRGPSDHWCGNSPPEHRETADSSREEGLAQLFEPRQTDVLEVFNSVLMLPQTRREPRRTGTPTKRLSFPAPPSGTGRGRDPTGTHPAPRRGSGRLGHHNGRSRRPAHKCLNQEIR